MAYRLQAIGLKNFVGGPSTNGRGELKIRVLGRAIALLVVYGTALQLASAVNSSYRYGNVTNITVSKLSDLDEVFEVRASSLRVKNPEFLKVCFATDYVYSLQDAKQWFAADQAEFNGALQAAGGSADTFNSEGNSSIVLLSRSSAVVLQFSLRTGFLVGNFGCAGADVDINIKRYETNSSTEVILPNATLRAPRQPPRPAATSCVENLERFVASIDEMLTKNEHASHEPYWAATRKYLPATGCRYEEVISVARTSKFFEQRTDSTIWFGNSDVIITGRVEKETGNIEGSRVSSTHPDSF